MPFTHRSQSIFMHSGNQAFRLPFLYQFHVVGRACNKTNKNKTEANLYISSDFTVCVQLNNLTLSQVKLTSMIPLWGMKETLCCSGSIFKDLVVYFGERELRGSGVEEEEKNLKQAPGPVQSLTWSPTQSSIPQPWKHDLSWSEESDAQLTKPPRQPCSGSIL